MKKINFIIDGSYFSYFTIFSAFSCWAKRVKLEIPNPDLDPTKDPEFIELLESRVIDRFENIFNTINEKFGIDLITNKIPIIFAFDCSHRNIWRNEKFSGYKLTRKLLTKPFNIGACFNYLFSTTLCLPQIAEGYNLVKMKHDFAEGDDVIGVIVKYLPADINFVIASDHDFLQLKDEKTHIINLFGDEIDFQKYLKDPQINNKGDFLLLKILVGDTADNIPHVFPKMARTRCAKLVKDKNLLMKMLKENEESLKQFKLNAELMDFAKIPEKIKTEICSECTTKITEFNERL